MSTLTEAVDDLLALWTRHQTLEREHEAMLELLKKIATDNLPRSAPHWRISRRSEAKRLVTGVLQRMVQEETAKQLAKLSKGGRRG